MGSNSSALQGSTSKLQADHLVHITLNHVPPTSADPRNEALYGRICSKALYCSIQDTCKRDLQGFHAEIAKRFCFWTTASGLVWRIWDGQRRHVKEWHFEERSTVQYATTQTDRNGMQNPWQITLDTSTKPRYSWFVGGFTNAVFSEVDCHVLIGHGHHVAFVEEPPAASQSEACTTQSISRVELLFRSAMAAEIMIQLGLLGGDCVLFCMPNIIEQVIWIQACKRIGVLYSCTPPDASKETIRHRVQDLNAKLVFTVMTIGSADTHQVAEMINQVLVELNGVARMAILNSTSTSKRDTCERVAGSDQFVRSIDLSPYFAQFEIPNLDPVDDGIVVYQVARDMFPRTVPPKPVEANTPMCVAYTSGSTGKPKGLVHVHGYAAGIAHTMRVVFNASTSDTMCVIANPGWITGQSYMLTGCMMCGVKSILICGSATQPTLYRFAEIIQRNNVNIFKAGSTFIRAIMTGTGAQQRLEEYDLTSLRIATFCAEPVNAAVQQFAAKHICPNYINSYWATEHGGIVFTNILDMSDKQLDYDAKTWPLPWVIAEVDDVIGQSGRGEVSILQPFPYMARAVWRKPCNEFLNSDSDLYATLGSHRVYIGDKECFETYFSGIRSADSCDDKPNLFPAFRQGDFAQKHADGAYTFHGRSDEVLNVAGNRIGTEEIENVILREASTRGNAVKNCVVVGLPDPVAFERPLAFVVLRTGDSGTTAALRRAILESIGSFAVPKGFVIVDDLPVTYSGKFSRRLLLSLATGESIESIRGSIRNKECIDHLSTAIGAWQRDTDSRPPLKPLPTPSEAAEDPIEDASQTKHNLGVGEGSSVCWIRETVAWALSLDEYPQIEIAHKTLIRDLALSSIELIGVAARLRSAMPSESSQVEAAALWGIRSLEDLVQHLLASLPSPECTLPLRQQSLTSQPACDIDFLASQWEDFFRALAEDKRKVVVLHVSLLELHLNDSESAERVTQIILQSVFDLVDRHGKICFLPTFTFSWCSGGVVFDPAHTPSETGSVTERFRKIVGTKRTTCPIYSHAYYGSGAFDDRLANLGSAETVWGAHSIFELFEDEDALVACIGGLHYATLVHVSEERNHVPYRHHKRFTGWSRDEGNDRLNNFNMYVRHRGFNADIHPGFAKIETLCAGALRNFPLENGSAAVVGCKSLLAAVDALLDQDPLSLLSERDQDSCRQWLQNDCK